MNKKEIIEKIKNGELDLLNLSNEAGDFEDDFDIVLEAIKQKVFPLRYASDRLKDNEEIVLEAVKQSLYALEYANKRLQNNKDIVMEAVKKSGYALRFASDRLKDNEEIVLEAMKKEESSLQYASDRLQNKYEFLVRLKSIDVDGLDIVTQKWYKERMDLLENLEDKLAMKKDVVLTNNKPKKLKF